MTRRAIGVSERPPLLQTIPLSLQHLFAMFGATVLVPYSVPLTRPPSCCSSGIGTLLYLFICKDENSRLSGIEKLRFYLPGAAAVAAGLRSGAGRLYYKLRRAVLHSSPFIVKSRYRLAGCDVPAWRQIGAIVAVISASNELAEAWRLIWPGCCRPTARSPDSKTIIISMVTALAVRRCSDFHCCSAASTGDYSDPDRELLVGYALSFVMGVVDTTPIAEGAHWFALPTFYTPRFEWFAIFTAHCPPRWW